MGLGNRKQLPVWRSKYVLWLIITIPGMLLLFSYVKGIIDYDGLMHATGEFSGRFLLFSLIATPLVILLPNTLLPQWFNRNKRYFGVAAFGYALLHTVVYLIEEPTQEVLSSFFEIGLLTAWGAFIIWIPMTITSTDRWVKRLKGNWKRIHNWGYLAALLAYLHWAFIHYHWKPALVHALPVLILQGIRWKNVFKKDSLS